MEVPSPAGVALGYWQDRDPMEAVATAELADSLGYRELWIGEMATFDAFALASAIGARTSSIGLTIGPLAPAVRDPAGLAMGVASVAALTGRPVHLAVGSSSPVVVQAWHGRRWVGTADVLRSAVAELLPLLAGAKAAPGGYRLRLAPPRSSVTVAAFGRAAVRVAAELADRMVINLCTPAQARSLRDALDAASSRAGRERLPLAAWVPAAVDPDDEAIEQLRSGVVGYLAAPGYGEMFAAAGFGDLVSSARAGRHPRDLLAQLPRDLVEAVGIVGDIDACRRRLDAYRDAGVDEVVVVPATGGDDGGRRTLTALAPPAPSA